MTGPKQDIDGVLLVDKPVDYTSHDIVAIARSAIRTRRVGHTGTLDPFATGLLVLLIGQATRLAQYVDGEPKVYEARIQFGSETDSDDVTGTVTREADPPTPDAVQKGIAQLTGTLDQMPPAYSAKQSGGVRAYDAARKGTPLPLQPARVTVHRWTILASDHSSLTARIECGGGTYIRALGRDLGRLSGSAAHLTSLRRLASGPFSVDRAVALPDLREGKYTLVDMVDALGAMPRHVLSADEVVRVRHGNPIAAATTADRVALVTAEERLAAIATLDGVHWQPSTVFPDG